MRQRKIGIVLLLVGAAAFVASCNDPARPGRRQGTLIETSLLCSCKPTHIAPDDWRIEFKNGSIPATPPTVASVADILAWPEGPEPGPRTPRFGRELTAVRVQTAYLQSAFLRRADCDLHLEVSDRPEKNAPRVIIETPGRVEYCSSRSKMFADLQQHGIALRDVNQELAAPLRVEILGTPFRDEAHPFWFARGSRHVATLWELHPAVVTIVRQ